MTNWNRDNLEGREALSRGGVYEGPMTEPTRAEYGAFLRRVQADDPINPGGHLESAYYAMFQGRLAEARAAAEAGKAVDAVTITGLTRGYEEVNGLLIAEQETRAAAEAQVAAMKRVTDMAQALDDRFFDGQEDWSRVGLPGEVDDLHDALQALTTTKGDTA